MIDTDRDRDPASNADRVVAELLGPAIALDARRLADCLRLLAARADQLGLLYRRGRAFERRLLAGRAADPPEASPELQAVIYEPLCLKWFVAQAARALAERLERDVREDQLSVDPVLRVTYGSDGQVESYQRERADGSRPEDWA